MTEIKPVYQTSIDNDSFFSKLNFTSMDESDRDRWIKSGHKVNTLYPAAAYEALQKENERLDFKFKHYWGRIRKVLQRHRERDAAQAKRIAELEAGVVDIRDWTARWTRPDHPIVKVADRLLSASKNGE